MKQAFTMIELIFVIVVLGILTSIAMPKYNGVQLDAEIAFEKNRIGAVRSTISAIHAKSIIKNGDFTALTDSPTGKGRTAIYIETSKHNYPLTLSVEDSINSTDNKYHLTEKNQLENQTGINGSVLAVIMTYSSRDKFSTGKSFTADGVTGKCDVNSNECKQLIEGPTTRATGIPASEEGIYEFNRRGAWVYDGVNGVIVYASQKDNGDELNIGKGDEDGSSPDF